jgi:hypothetical protein
MMPDTDLEQGGWRFRQAQRYRQGAVASVAAKLGVKSGDSTQRRLRCNGRRWAKLVDQLEAEAAEATWAGVLYAAFVIDCYFRLPPSARVEPEMPDRYTQYAMPIAICASSPSIGLATSGKSMAEVQLGAASV